MKTLKMIAVPTAFAVAFGLAALSGAAPAQAAEKTAEQLSKTCKVCHPKNPKAGDLAKLSAQDIADKLMGFRSGEVKGTMMNALAKKYTDKQIEGLGAIFGKK